ncbi:MAG: hypothetical protein ACOZDY_15115 [Pseudomonadota bacterium]
MADARARELPLVGGGDRDRAEILSRWGVLHLDGTLARALTAAGMPGAAGCAAWLCVRRRRREADG